MKKIVTCYLEQQDLKHLETIAERHDISRNAVVAFGVKLALMVYEADRRGEEVQCVLPRKNTA